LGLVGVREQHFRQGAGAPLNLVEDRRDPGDVAADVRDGRELSRMEPTESVQALVPAVRLLGALHSDESLGRLLADRRDQRTLHGFSLIEPEFEQNPATRVDDERLVDT